MHIFMTDVTACILLSVPWVYFRLTALLMGVHKENCSNVTILGGIIAAVIRYDSATLLYFALFW